MKIKNWKLYLIIAVVIAIGVFLVYKLAFADNNASLQTISISEFENKIKAKDTFILVITQTGCSHCEQYLPELNRTLSDNNITAYELNVTGLSTEDGKRLAQYVNFSGTPTTVFYNKGEEQTTLNRIIGYASQKKIEERLRSLGFID